MESLAASIEPSDTITLDVTHGFRHLPMLAMIAARYLSHVKNVHVQDIYYGALDMSSSAPDGTDITPVLKLNGMLKMLDWVETLAAYHKSGNYGLFSKLYKDDGMPESHAKRLEEAAFFERTGNATDARQHLNTLLESLDNHSQPLGRLFKEPLNKQIAWTKQKHRGQWEIQLAKRYLNREDFFRSIIFLFEGLISNTVYKSNTAASIHEYDVREDARRQLISNSEEMAILNALRNAVAHGTIASNSRLKVRNAAMRLLKDKTALKSQLQSWIDRFGRA